MDENWDSFADRYVALVRGGSAMHEFSRDILLSQAPDIMISHAQRTECVDSMGIRHRIDDGSTLSAVADDSVEWVTAALSLNNIPAASAGQATTTAWCRPISGPC